MTKSLLTWLLAYLLACLVFVATANAAPGPVTGIKTTTDQNSATLTWDATAGATSYRARLWSGGTGVTTQNTGSARSATFSGLSCDKTYAFSVTAYQGSLGPATVVSDRTASCVDTTAPTTSFTAPSSGSTVSGTITVSASVNDTGGSGAWFAAFRHDTQSGSPDQTIYAPGPYSYQLDTTTLADGPHTLYVRAEDNAQNIGQDASVSFTVDNTTPPPPPPPPGTEPAPIAGQGYHQAFRDDFTSLDRSVWDDHIWYDETPNPAWQNAYGGFQYVDSSGVLHLHTSRNFIGDTGVPYAYNTITTQSSGKTWLHGYFEARMKWTGGTGAWPGFWLYSYRHATNDAYPKINPYCAANGLPAAQCYSGELDAFEGQGSQPQGFYGTVHRNSCDCYGAADAQNDNNYDDTGTNLTQGFHDYGMLWTATTISWYLDGRLLHSAPVYDSTEQPMFMLLQMWSGGWMGDPNSTTPNDLDTQVDSVTVWQK